MNILAITQARFGSTRLPGKVLLPMGHKTVLDLHLRRIKMSKMINKFMVATTEEVESNQIAEIAKRQGFEFFRGSLNDVLDRFYQAASTIKPDYIVRLTSDCPLIDPGYIDDLIQKYLKSGADYGSNCLKPTLPDGMDAEIFTFKALETAWQKAKKNSQREHVTPYIRESGQFRLFSVEYKPDLSPIRMTLDTQEDYFVLKSLVDACGEEVEMEKYVEYLLQHPEIQNINVKFERNEGYKNSLKKD